MPLQSEQRRRYLFFLSRRISCWEEVIVSPAHNAFLSSSIRMQPACLATMWRGLCSHEVRNPYTCRCTCAHSDLFSPQERQFKQRKKQRTSFSVLANNTQRQRSSPVKQDSCLLVTCIESVSGRSRGMGQFLQPVTSARRIVKCLSTALCSVHSLGDISSIS
jgi:hypothetical protein